jgi:hypothetical protein
MPGENERQRRTARPGNGQPISMHVDPIEETFHHFPDPKHSLSPLSCLCGASSVRTGKYLSLDLKISILPL